MVVGASECGLSAIEELLIDENFYFTSIALLSPDGVTVGGVGDFITGRNIGQLGLNCRVTTVGAEMTYLDRRERRIGLATGEDISYDYLLLTAGLQVTLHQKSKPQTPAIALKNMQDPADL